MSADDETFINNAAGGVNQAVVEGGRHRSSSEPDPGTLDACRRGDRGALGRVLKERAPMLGRLIAHLIGPGPDVEDLLQITLVSAVRGFRQFRGEATLDTWLQRIAINAVTSHFRRPEASVQVSLRLLAGNADAPDPRPSPEQTVDDRRRLERLYHHLAALTAEKRIAFLLNVVEGLPPEEIAVLTGAGRFAVRSRIFWAGRALRSKAKKDPILRDLLPEPKPAPVKEKQ